MPETAIDALVGQLVVLDFSSPFVCIGRLVGVDESFFRVLDADLHDFRDSSATREVYVYNSARVGVRRNRARVIVRRDEVIAVTLFSDVSET